MDKNKKNTTPINDDMDKYFDINNVASSTECTGLKPTPALSEEDEESYTDIYNIPKRPQ